MTQAAWMLCARWGPTAEHEADTLACQLEELGAGPAARIWRDLARIVREMRSGETTRILQ